MDYLQQKKVTKRLWQLGNLCGVLVLAAVIGWEFVAVLLLWYIAFIKEG